MYRQLRCKQSRGRSTFPLLTATVLLALFATVGCTVHDAQPFGPDRLIPPDQSRTTFTPEASPTERESLTEAARMLSCGHPLGCTCFLDGIRTSCAFAFSCIDSGLCECVSGCGNIRAN